MSKIGKTFAQYNVLSAIGGGGMGEVFLAEDTKLGRRVALKFLAAELCSQPDHLQRFVLEAQAASGLNHPNICIIHEINLDSGSPFIAMEYMEGETLANMISRRRRSARQTLDIAVQVAEALAEAHAKAIIHRDIKPANIIINGKGRAKVLDFGLAKKLLNNTDDPMLTQAGMILGTASYMSPEQARGLEMDGRTDIWSLGVCMYETLTGKQPFLADNVTDTLAAVLTAEPPPPSEFFADIPAELERIVMKMIRKIRDERHDTAEDLLTDLKKLQKRLEFESEAVIKKPRSEEVTASFDLATTEYAAAITGQDLKDRNLRPNNLSEQYSPIIGREKEIDAILELIKKDGVRLVTMSGVGGTGKTRLSQAVAEAALLDFIDGVFFIELSPVTDAALVISTIAQPLGIKDEGSKPVIDVLSEHLRDKQMLLVIDNFEQVVDAAPQIGKLLATAPQLKVLVTSRFLLHLTAEVEYVVPPLITPLTDAVPSFNDLRQNASVLLFTERAKSAKPTFMLTETNASVVAEICTRLDGLPLAIELAAARVRVLSPENILSRFANRLDLLSTSTRDLPARQQTMRGAVEWSYDLLDEHEKAAFRSFAVFNGGFRIEAAESILSGNDSNTPEVFEIVSSLFDKSLLIQKEMPDGELRFRMLEVVRDYALESLEKAGESVGLRQRHAEYFTAFGEQAEPFIQAAQSAEWLDRLAEEHTNLNAAMNWSLENDHSMAVRLAAALRNYWLLHGHLAEGYRWLKAALEPGGEPAELRLKLLSGLGLASRFKGDFETARKAYSEGLAAGRESGDKKGTALSMRGLGLVALQQNEAEEAKHYFAEGLSISRELGDDFGIAISLSFLGDVYRTEGKNAEARPLFEESVELFRKVDNKSAVSDALNNLGAAAFGEKDLSAARENFTEALRISSELGNKITISFSLDGFAALKAADGDLERAAYISGAAEYLRDSIGYQIEPAERTFRENYLAGLMAEMPPGHFDLASKTGFSAKSAAAVIAAILS